jgi:hypothetical protein
MPITPTFDPTTGASGGAPSGGGASEPGLTVTGRADGEAYNVSAGARSLSISNPDGATLSTTVEQASTGGAITVTGSTGTTPSWTAPSGSTTGEAVQVRVKATKGGLSTSVGFTERVAGSGGAGSWEMVKDIDLTDVTTAAAISGSGSIGFESNSDTITVNRTTSGSGTMAAMTPTNGQGIVFSQESGNGTGALSLLISDVMATWTREESSEYIYAIQLVITGITYPVANTSIFQYVLNRGNTTVFNSGNAKGWRFIDNNDGSNENVRLRANGSTTGSLGVQTIRTSKVLTWILFGGELVQGQQTDGTALPTPAPGAANTYTLGSSSVGLNDTTPVYVTNGLRVTTGCTNATQTLTRIAIRRFK